MYYRMRQTGQEPDYTEALQTVEFQIYSKSSYDPWRVLSKEVTYSQTIAIVSFELGVNEAGWRQGFAPLCTSTSLSNNILWTQQLDLLNYWATQKSQQWF